MIPDPPAPRKAPDDFLSIEGQAADHQL